MQSLIHHHHHYQISCLFSQASEFVQSQNSTVTGFLLAVRLRTLLQTGRCARCAAFSQAKRLPLQRDVSSGKYISKLGSLLQVLQSADPRPFFSTEVGAEELAAPLTARGRFFFSSPLEIRRFFQG